MSAPANSTGSLTPSSAQSYLRGKSRAPSVHFLPRVEHVSAASPLASSTTIGSAPRSPSPSPSWSSPRRVGTQPLKSLPILSIAQDEQVPVSFTYPSIPRQPVAPSSPLLPAFSPARSVGFPSPTLSPSTPARRQTHVRRISYGFSQPSGDVQAVGPSQTNSGLGLDAGPRRPRNDSNASSIGFDPPRSASPLLAASSPAGSVTAFSPTLPPSFLSPDRKHPTFHLPAVNASFSLGFTRRTEGEGRPRGMSSSSISSLGSVGERGSTAYRPVGVDPAEQLTSASRISNTWDARPNEDEETHEAPTWPGLTIRSPTYDDEGDDEEEDPSVAAAEAEAEAGQVSESPLQMSPTPTFVEPLATEPRESGTSPATTFNEITPKGGEGEGEGPKLVINQVQKSPEDSKAVPTPISISANSTNIPNSDILQSSPPSPSHDLLRPQIDDTLPPRPPTPPADIIPLVDSTLPPFDDNEPAFVLPKEASLHHDSPPTPPITASPRVARLDVADEDPSSGIPNQQAEIPIPFTFPSSPSYENIHTTMPKRSESPGNESDSTPTTNRGRGRFFTNPLSSSSAVPPPIQSLRDSASDTEGPSTSSTKRMERRSSLPALMAGIRRPKRRPTMSDTTKVDARAVISADTAVVSTPPPIEKVDESVTSLGTSEPALTTPASVPISTPSQSEQDTALPNTEHERRPSSRDTSRSRTSFSVLAGLLRPRGHSSASLLSGSDGANPSSPPRIPRNTSFGSLVSLASKHLSHEEAKTAPEEPSQLPASPTSETVLELPSVAAPPTDEASIALVDPPADFAITKELPEEVFVATPSEIGETRSVTSDHPAELTSKLLVINPEVVAAISEPEPAHVDTQPPLIDIIAPSPLVVESSAAPEPSQIPNDDAVHVVEAPAPEAPSDIVPPNDVVSIEPTIPASSNPASSENENTSNQAEGVVPNSLTVEVEAPVELQLAPATVIDEITPVEVAAAPSEGVDSVEFVEAGPDSRVQVADTPIVVTPFDATVDSETTLPVPEQTYPEALDPTEAVPDPQPTYVEGAETALGLEPKPEPEPEPERIDVEHPADAPIVSTESTESSAAVEASAEPSDEVHRDEVLHIPEVLAIITPSEDVAPKTHLEPPEHLEEATIVTGDAEATSKDDVEPPLDVVILPSEDTDSFAIAETLPDRSDESGNPPTADVAHVEAGPPPETVAEIPVVVPLPDSSVQSAVIETSHESPARPVESALDSSLVDVNDVVASAGGEIGPELPDAVPVPPPDDVVAADVSTDITEAQSPVAPDILAATSDEPTNAVVEMVSASVADYEPVADASRDEAVNEGAPDERDVVDSLIAVDSKSSEENVGLSVSATSLAAPSAPPADVADVADGGAGFVEPPAASIITPPEDEGDIVDALGPLAAAAAVEKVVESRYDGDHIELAHEAPPVVVEVEEIEGSPVIVVVDVPASPSSNVNRDEDPETLHVKFGPATSDPLLFTHTIHPEEPISLTHPQQLSAARTTRFASPMSEPQADISALEPVIQDETADKLTAAASTTQLEEPSYPSPPASDHGPLDASTGPIASTSASANGDASESEATAVSPDHEDSEPVPVLPNELVLSHEELIALASGVQKAPQDTGFFTILPSFIIDMTIEISTLLWGFLSTTGKDWTIILTKAWFKGFIITPLFFFFLAPAMLVLSMFGRVANGVYGYFAPNGDRDALTERFDAYMLREKSKLKNGKVKVASGKDD